MFKIVYLDRYIGRFVNEYIVKPDSRPLELVSLETPSFERNSVKSGHLMVWNWRVKAGNEDPPGPATNR
jgi:hypothetical protein